MSWNHLQVASQCWRTGCRVRGSLARYQDRVGHRLCHWGGQAGWWDVDHQVRIHRSSRTSKKSQVFYIFVHRLTSYINMFGLKFSKEDHVSLIRLFYQVLVQVDMDPPTMYQAAITLNTLLESRHLIEVSNFAPPKLPSMDIQGSFLCIPAWVPVTRMATLVWAVDPNQERGPDESDSIPIRISNKIDVSHYEMQGLLLLVCYTG